MIEVKKIQQERKKAPVDGQPVKEENEKLGAPEITDDALKTVENVLGFTDMTENQKLSSCRTLYDGAIFPSFTRGVVLHHIIKVRPWETAEPQVYHSFEEYILGEYGLQKWDAYRYMHFARVNLDLQRAMGVTPTSLQKQFYPVQKQSHAEVLFRLPDSEMRHKTWMLAEEMTQQEMGDKYKPGRFSAERLDECAAKIYPEYKSCLAKKLKFSPIQQIVTLSCSVMLTHKLDAKTGAAFLGSIRDMLDGKIPTPLEPGEQQNFDVALATVKNKCKRLEKSKKGDVELLKILCANQDILNTVSGSKQECKAI